MEPSSRTEMTDRFEVRLLGSILRWPEQFPEISAKVRASDFRVDAHQWIFRGMLALCESNRPIDLAFLSDWLRDVGVVDRIGGYGFIGSIWDTEATGAHGLHLAREVRNSSIFRELAFAAAELEKRALEANCEASEMLEEAERKIFAISEMGTEGESVSLTAAVNECFDLYDRRSGRDGGKPLLGVSTGFTDLDRLTGGLHDSELVIVAARPSVGKTAFGLNVARHVAIRQKLPVFVASIEQARTELADRMLSAEGLIDSISFRLARLNDDEMGRMIEAGNILRAAPMHIDDNAIQTVLRIGATARRLKRKHGLRLIVVDYLQLVQPESRRDTRQEQVAGISRRLKIIARDLCVPVLCMAQLNRGAEEHKRPRLSDLRESGAIEQDADVVMLLNRSENAPWAIDVQVEKQRNGPTGDVRLVWEGKYMRFSDYAEQPVFASEIPR